MFAVLLMWFCSFWWEHPTCVSGINGESCPWRPW